MLQPPNDCKQRYIVSDGLSIQSAPMEMCKDCKSKCDKGHRCGNWRDCESGSPQPAPCWIYMAPRFFSGTSCMSCPHLHERVQQVRHFHLRLQTLINREACIIHHEAGTISPKRIRVREYRNVAPATHGCLATAFDLSLESQMGSIFSDPDRNDKSTCFKHILESIHQGISKHASRAVVFYRCKALVLLRVHPSCNANSFVKVLIDKSNRRKAIPMQVTTSIGPPSSMRTSRKLLHLHAFAAMHPNWICYILKAFLIASDDKSSLRLKLQPMQPFQTSTHEAHHSVAILLFWTTSVAAE